MTVPTLQFLFLIAATGAAAQSRPSPNSVENGDSPVTFRPSIAIVIGIFSVMFFLTFLLLMYGKFCRINTSTFLNTAGTLISGDGSRRDDCRSSGIDKTVIESLPFFRFSALKGSREGLECSVCLSRFSDAETLRLLPRCKHAFHVDCIDRWLESHSTCPLCRARVDADDIGLYKCSASSSYRAAPEIVEEGGETGLELYVEREQDPTVGASSSFRWTEMLRFRFKAAAAPPPPHNCKHRILVSQVFRSRWSDFNSADLMSLDSEMLRVVSSRRFEAARFGGGGISEGVSRIKEEMDKKRILESKAVRMQMLAEEHSSEFSAGEMRALISPASRCMSDITTARSDRTVGIEGGKEEKVRQIWLPIARRTVQWFAGKDGKTTMRLEGGGDGEQNL